MLAQHVRLGELHGLRTLQGRAERKHPDLAFIGLQVGNKRSEARFHEFELGAELFGKLARKVDVESLQLVRLRIPKRDCVIQRIHADPQLLRFGDFEQS
jgi:hypothetical protein